MQSLLSLSVLPWSFKPLFGLCSDSFGFRGQHRKPYLILAAAIGVAAWAGLALISSVGGSGVPLWALGLLLTLSNLSTALSDVIVDAMVRHSIAKHNIT